MAWQPGQSGNPSGQVKDPRHSFIKMVQRAIDQEDGKRLRQAAERLLDLAAEGESWAIQALADRLDGKPGQSIVIAGDQEQPLLTKVVVELVNSQRTDPESP